jgi:hypothetical protein
MIADIIIVEKHKLGVLINGMHVVGFADFSTSS